MGFGGKIITFGLIFYKTTIFLINRNEYNAVKPS